MGCFLPKNLYGVIGWPLGQSLSPLMHNTGFQTLGLDGVYLAWPVAEDQLQAFIESLRLLKIKGLSVTIPHKIAIMALLDNMSEAAALAGAVNTLFWRDNELYGENTDVTGFLQPLSDLRLESMDVLLLGAGGAAHAAAAGLRLAGCRQVRVASPGNKSQYHLAERFSFMPISWEERYARPATLIINSTPVGMHGALEALTPYDFAQAPAVNHGYAYDLVYNPVETVFLKEALNNGRQCISGLEMFIGQGNEQFKLWTGENLPEAAITAVKQALI